MKPKLPKSIKKANGVLQNNVTNHSIGESFNTCAAEFMPYATIDTCFFTSSPVTNPCRAR